MTLFSFASFSISRQQSKRHFFIIGKIALHLLFGWSLDEDKKVWINPNNSHESLDRSKLRLSQTPTIHPSEFFGHITFSVPNIKLLKMKSESCWKLYNIQLKNSIMIMWSVQLCIARMGVDGGGPWRGLHGFCV